MTAGIFATQAPLYWARNLRVIPVESRSKQPMLKGWTGHLASAPSEETKKLWQDKYSDCGTGLLLGQEVIPGGHLIALDIDDDRLVRLGQQVLRLGMADGPLLAGKRGKKGMTIFVRAPKTVKSATIQGGAGLGNIDVLASGRMTVMPPSIHPDTDLPYETVGSLIYEIELERLPEISKHEIDLLKVAIGSEHALALMSGSGTHDAGVALVAALIAAGASGEETETIILGLLPENYEGDSVKELPEWIRSAQAKGFQKNAGKRESLTSTYLEIARVNCTEFFHDGDGTTFASVPSEKGTLVHRVSSESFKSWLRHLIFKATGKPAASASLSEAIASLSAMAQYSGNRQIVQTRVAGDGQCVEIDLGAVGGEVVRIDDQGWRLEPMASFKFIRGSGFSQLPAPGGKGGLLKLKDLLNLSERNYRLLVAFLVNALRSQGPYFILLVEGEQGSGKSFFCEIIKCIIDPNKALRLRLPDTEQNLMIHAKEYRLLSYDNASGMKADMSDALCSLATGGGIAVRKLYTDGDLHVMTYARPFVINGISGYANRPDLMERAIPIVLDPLDAQSRKTEKEMRAAFMAIWPSILADLYEAVAQALRTVGQVASPSHLRMADAAQWIRAAEPALGFDQDEIIDEISKAQVDFLVDRVNDEPLVMRLRALTRAKPFQDYIGALFTELDAQRETGMPKSASQLTKQLMRLRPAMEKAGIHVEFGAKDRRGRTVKIWCEPLGGPPNFDVTG